MNFADLPSPVADQGASLSPQSVDGGGSHERGQTPLVHQGSVKQRPKLRNVLGGGREGEGGEEEGRTRMCVPYGEW